MEHIPPLKFVTARPCYEKRGLDTTQCASATR
jgi:hypothetical protein